MSQQKKAVVTDVHREESKRLRALWDGRRKKTTQAEFGQAYGIGSQAAVGQFLNGHAAISLKAAKGFARGLDCEIADFSERLAQEAAALGEVSGASATIDVMSLSRDEMRLLMLYRRMQPLHQTQMMDFGAKLHMKYLMQPVMDMPTIDDLVGDLDEDPHPAPRTPRATRNREKA